MLESTVNQFASLVSLCHNPTLQPLVMYDSVFGSTERIARAIADGATGWVEVLRAGDMIPAELDALDLLLVGFPTLVADSAKLGMIGRAALLWSMSAQKGMT